MSSSVSSQQSFTLTRWLHCPPASLEEQRLAVRSIQSLTIHLQGIIEEQCDKKLLWRRQKPYEVLQAHEAHQRQLHQQRQDQYQPEEHQEQRREQEEQEEQEEQNRQEQHQWEATQTLCGPLADLQGDLIAYPSPQASHMPSTIVTAPAPYCQTLDYLPLRLKFWNHKRTALPQDILHRDQPLIDGYEADTKHQGGADDIKEDWHLSGQG